MKRAHDRKQGQLQQRTLALDRGDMFMVSVIKSRNFSSINTRNTLDLQRTRNAWITVGEVKHVCLSSAIYYSFVYICNISSGTHAVSRPPQLESIRFLTPLYTLHTTTLPFEQNYDDLER